jgi:hypothetical protein
MCETNMQKKDCQIQFSSSELYMLQNKVGAPGVHLGEINNRLLVYFVLTSFESYSIHSSLNAQITQGFIGFSMFSHVPMQNVPFIADHPLVRPLNDVMLL